MTKNIIISIIFITSWHLLNATSGQLDTTFGSSGLRATPVSRQDNLTAITINPSDSIIITGATQTTAPTIFLAQYTSSGALDTTFNSGGSVPGTQTLLVGTRSEANAIALDASNKILIAGFAIQSQTNFLLARYTTAGVLDTTFNTTGYLTYSIGTGANATGVGVQSSGNIIIAGSSVNGGTPSFTLARFTSSGSLDTTFGTSGIVLTNPGVINILNAIAIQSDDKIVAIGTADNNLTIVRYNTNGSIDTGFGTSGIFQPNIDPSVIGYDVTLDSSGNIIISASIVQSSITKSMVIRLTSSGALDTTFNTVGYVITSIIYGSEYYSVAVQSDNKIIASGYTIGPLSNQVSIARYLTNGTLDATYGTSGITATDLSGDTAVTDVKLQSTNNAITAGLSNGTFFLQRYLF
jgi:uncharacterized delta-60 repeat protein